MNRWMKYLLWIVGMFLITYLGDHWINAEHRWVEATAKLGAYVWVDTAVPFLCGLYLSLLFVKRSFRIKFPLLFLVFLPSFLALIYVPLAFSMHLPINFGMTQSNVITFEGIVAGLSLILAFFS